MKPCDRCNGKGEYGLEILPKYNQLTRSFSYYHRPKRCIKCKITGQIPEHVEKDTWWDKYGWFIIQSFWSTVFTCGSSLFIIPFYFVFHYYICKFP